MFLDIIYPKRSRRDISASQFGQWMDAFLFGQESASGVKVNEDVALTLPTFYLGVRKIAEAVSCLPLNLYKRDNTNRKELEQNSLIALLRNNPHPLMSATDFYGYVMRCLLIKGTHYSLIIRSAGGEVNYLVPWDPDLVEVIRVDRPDGPGLEYIFTTGDKNQKFTRTEKDVFRVAGPLSDDGIKGKNIIRLMVDSIGRAKAQEIFSNKLFANGTKMSVIIKTKGVSDEQKLKFYSDQWKEHYSGLDNAFKAAFLPLEWDVQPISLKPEEAQMIESQKFSVIDFCRILNIPPHKIYDLSNAHFNNIEHQNIEWLSDAVRPWLIRIEQALNRDLLTAAEKPRLYFRFNSDAILRTDIKTRYESYKTALTHGFITINEIREKEDLNPIEGGDFSLIPLNHVPVTPETIAGLVDQYLKKNEDQSQPDEPTDPAPSNQDQPDAPEPDNLDEPERNLIESAIEKRKEKVREILLPLYRDAVGRFVRKEVHRANQQLEKSNNRTDFSNWCAKFHDSHGEYIRSCLQPVFTSVAAINRSDIDKIKKYLDSFSYRYCADQPIFTHFCQKNAINGYEKQQQDELIEAEIPRILDILCENGS